MSVISAEVIGSLDYKGMEADLLAGIIPPNSVLDAVHSENLVEQRKLSTETQVARRFITLMKRLGVSQDTQAGIQGLIARDLALLNVSTSTMESRVCALLDYCLLTEISAELGWFGTDIVTIKKEVRLSCGIADRVLYHADGSATVVEVKDRGCRRSAAGGIGQALVYASALRIDSRIPDVRQALCVGGDRDEYIAAACQSAGVLYINIPDCVAEIIDDYAAVAAEVRRQCAPSYP